MNLLLIQSASLSDLIHALPALCDARHHLPSLRVDCAVEERYTEVPFWHESVEQVFPIARHRWQHDKAAKRTEMWSLLRALRGRGYDYVIDAEGSRRSARLAAWARGLSVGYDKPSAREASAAILYRHRISVARDQHTIDRTRKLFALALGYEVPRTPPQFGIQLPQRDAAHRLYEDQLPATDGKPYLVFLCGTDCAVKRWPPSHWKDLTAHATEAGCRVFLYGDTPRSAHDDHTTHRASASNNGDGIEKKGSQRNVAENADAQVLAPMSWSALAHLLASAAGVVALDSGSGHLAAALGAPCIGLYGASDAVQAGLTGQRAWNVVTNLPCAPCRRNVCTLPERDPNRAEPPCMYSQSAEGVWQRLQSLLAHPR